MKFFHFVNKQYIHRSQFPSCVIRGLMVLSVVLFSVAGQAQTESYLRVETNVFARIPVELKECQPLQQANTKDASRVLDILDNDLWMSSVIASFRTDEQLGGSNSPWLEISSKGPAQPFRTGSNS